MNTAPSAVGVADAVEALVALEAGAETFQRLTGQIEQANYDRLFPGLRPAAPTDHA